MTGGGKVEKPVANRCAEGANTGSWVKQPKYCLRLRREEIRHELANFGRSEKLALFLAIVERGQPFVLGLQSEGIREQRADGGVRRWNDHGAAHPTAILSTSSRELSGPRRSSNDTLYSL